MKKVLAVIVLLFVFAMHLEAQPPSKFYTTFGGNGDDIAYSGKQTLDGQYIVAGSTSSYGNGNTDVYLVKVDSMGSPIWAKFYGGIGNDVGKSVIQLSDSGYVVAGFTNSYGAGGYDAFLLRTDKNGVLIWQRTFGGLDWDFSNDLVLASDGNIFMVGNTSSFGSGKKDGFVVKYDLSGNLLLQKFIGGIENEELTSIIVTNDNFLAAVGYTESRGDINGDGYFLKLDLNGDTLFTKMFGGPLKDFANDLVQKASGDFVIAGAMTFTTYAESLMYTISSTGSDLYQRHLLKKNEDESFVSVTNSSKIPFVTVFTRSVNFPGLKRQGQIFAMVPSGYEFFINESGGYEDEYEYSVEATKDGGYLNVGSTNSYGSVGLDVYFIKRDSVALYYSSLVGLTESPRQIKPLILHANQYLVVNFQGQQGEEIDVIGIDGKLIQSFSVSGDEKGIDMSKYSESIYIIRVRFNNGQYVYSKFIN